MKKKILIQFDPDRHTSTFDSVVAIDSGVDHLLSQPNVSPEDVEGLVHGAMFTRGPADLHQTALFFGGSDVAKTEELVEKAKACFFGPIRVSLMSDPNGSNTTAAAAVLCVQKHLDFNRKKVVILAGTGPVGQRIAKIIGGCLDIESVSIALGSRKLEKAERVCQEIQQSLDASDSETKVNWLPIQAGTTDECFDGIADADIVFSAGAAGIELLDERWKSIDRQLVLVDINAVPPVGIAGVEVMDRGEERDNAICYGAIGVGGLKMKIHKKSIEALFDANDQILETETIYRLGKSI